MDMNILDELGIEPLNPGACWGADKWSHSTHTARLSADDPATNDRIAEVQSASLDDYEVVLSSSLEAFREWRTVPAPQRGELVRRLADELRRYKQPLGQLVTMETGKLREEGLGEVQEMIDIADFAVGQSRMLYGKSMHSERPQHRMYEQWHPLGVVGVITAFNFPVAVWAWNAFIAAIAGDTVVWKPSPHAPLSAIAVQHICNRVLASQGYPAVFTHLIEADTGLVERLVADRRIALISFTGSSAVGRRVGQEVAGRLGKTILELSGNNAVIVEETADLGLAIPTVVFGAVGTTGQRCTSTRRLFVHHSRYEELVTRLVHAYRQVRVGDPQDSKVLMGPLISPAAVETFKAAIDRSRSLGGEILFGGEVLEGPGNFVMPTLIRAQNDWDIVQRETFAPILYVIPYGKFEEAIALQNAVAQGLSSALFTTNLQRAERFLSATGSDCGIANVNIGTSGAEIGGAFGGEKETGGGRESGSDAWKAYMRRQTNTINWGEEAPLAQGIRFDLG